MDWNAQKKDYQMPWHFSYLLERFRNRLITTNMVERLNEEVRRRERVIRIFPYEFSAYWLIGAILIEIDERWSTERLYLNIDILREWLEKKDNKKEHNG